MPEALSTSPLVDACSPKAVEFVELNISLSSVQMGGFLGGAPWCCGGGGGGGGRGGPVCLPLGRLAAGQGDVAQVEDRKRVSLRVEDPTLKRHQVVAGEQQVQIPGGGGGYVGKRGVHGGR